MKRDSSIKYNEQDKHIYINGAILIKSPSLKSDQSIELLKTNKNK